MDKSRILRGSTMRQVVVTTCLIGVALTVTDTVGAQGSPGDPIDAGTFTIVDAAAPSNVLTEGDGNSVFLLRLPDGSTCPGDSANDDWRIQSFIVPAGDDPASIRFGEIRPEGGGPRHAIYSTDTQPLVHMLLGQNEGPGQPGLIPQPPPLSFAVFPPGTLPDGNYRIGLACTLFRESAKYWDAELVVSADKSVPPGELRWRLASAPEAGADDTGADSDSGWLGPLVIVGVGAAVLAFVFFIRRHNAAEPLALTKEQQ